MTDQNPLRLHYYRRVPNVGDAINVNVVRHLTGRDIEPHDGEKPHLLCIGSLMAHSKRESLVWGAGAMFWNKLGEARPENVYAVRGKLTAKAFAHAGMPLGDIPLGDPGFLAPEVTGVQATAPEFDLGLVPHYVDQTHPDIVRLSQSDRCLFIDVRADPVTVLTSIARCRAIASTSLHGLIFAEALGLPNLWVQATGKIAGGGFKFRDWYSTTRKPQTDVVQIWEDTPVSELLSAAELRESLIDKDALLSAFPHAELARLSVPVTLQEGQRAAQVPERPGSAE